MEAARFSVSSYPAWPSLSQRPLRFRPSRGAFAEIHHLAHWQRWATRGALAFGGTMALWWNKAVVLQVGIHDMEVCLNPSNRSRAIYGTSAPIHLVIPFFA